MKAFKDCSRLSQIRRFRKLALKALKDFPIQPKDLAFVNYAENTTFRVETQTQRYLLRLHRPGYMDRPHIESEIQWLQALKADGFKVQEALPNHQQQWVSRVHIDEIPEPTLVSLLTWIDGRIFSKPQPHHFEKTGALAAQLHDHTKTWQAPPSFNRSDLLQRFLPQGPNNLSRDEVWAFFTKAQRTLVEHSLQQFWERWHKLGQKPENYGLIHGDLHSWNLVFQGPIAAPIDFDDCGYGHYLFDLAVILSNWLEAKNYKAYRQALFRGYNIDTRLSQREHQSLDLYLRARLADCMLWIGTRALIHPGFRKGIQPWFQSIHRRLQALTTCIDEQRPFLGMTEESLNHSRN